MRDHIRTDERRSFTRVLSGLWADGRVSSDERRSRASCQDWEDGRVASCKEWDSLRHTRNVDSLRHNTRDVVTRVVLARAPCSGGRTRAFDAEMMRTLASEAHALAQLRHPHVVQYYGLSVYRDHIYIVVRHVVVVRCVATESTPVARRGA